MPSSSAWITFCACAACELTAGQVYGFGLFSGLLRDPARLGLSQGEVETVAVAENLGQYFRIAGGLTYDRLGARLTLLAGLMMNSLGYLAIYSAVRASEGEDGWRAPTPLVCFFALLYGQGAGWIETTVVSCTLANFPSYRAEAAGLLKTFFGVASAVGSVAFAAVFAPSQEKLLLGLALLPVLASPLSLLVRLLPKGAGAQEEQPWAQAHKHINQQYNKFK